MSKSLSMIRGAHLAVVASAIVALAGCGRNGPPPANGNDGGNSSGGICTTNKDCPAGEVCQSGTCGPPTACQRDSDCNPGQVCNVLTGKCQAGGSDGGTDGGTSDGGTNDGGSGDGGTHVCTPGTTQCSADGTGIETCSQDGTSWNTTACGSATPVCVNATCLLCAPGSTKCNGNTQETCSQDGSSWNGTDCTQSGGTCNGGLCQVCSPGTYQCKDQATSEACNSTGTAWVDTACANGICDSTTGQCKTTTCIPGSPDICQGSKVVSCKSDGSGYTTVTDCSTQGDTCQGGKCISLCQQAVANNSYIGCTYYPVVLSNSELAAKFQADYALVVSNPNANTSATINFYKAGQTTAFKTVTVAGGQVQTIKLPWNALSAVQSNLTASPVTYTAQTQSGAIAYKMVSSVPVTVYQFNPIASAIPSGCTADTDCPNYPNETCDTTTGTCSQSDYSFTNDASLLLPAHIFGTTGSSPASTYVAATIPHEMVSEDCNDPCAGLLGGQTVTPLFQADQPSFVAVVATQDNTTVTIKPTGGVAAGGGVSKTAPGTTMTETLSQGEVLQLASDVYGTPTKTGPVKRCDASGGNCATCGICGNVEDTFNEYPQSDLTGSVITSDKPIAVYAGADCSFVPYDKFACDHMEQQLFPFQNWGDKYIGAVSKPTGQASVGDLWEIVAAENGTKVSFDPPISGVSNPTTLAAGQKIQFTTANHFLVSSQDLQHPILVSQFFQGEQAHQATVGDPTMILAVPVEQYRTDYAFSTPTTIAQDYMNVIRPTGVAVTLDGQPVSPASGWTTVGSSGYQVGQVSITGGTHRLSSAQPVGLTVYGYDSYVSYGYPGGLDLKQTVIIVPGG